jgi:hypothetical protein
MQLSCRLTNDEHVIEFSVTHQVPGWVVCEEEDAIVVRRRHRNDWHLVELDFRMFRLKASRLKDQGWVEVLERAAFASA